MSKEDLEKLSMSFSKEQSELQELMSSRQQLETQFQENDIVLKEFKTLKDDAKIYKLTGPVLLPQDLSEANMNVEKRLEFIRKEIEQVEKKIESKQSSLQSIRNKLIELRK